MTTRTILISFEEMQEIAEDREYYSEDAQSYVGINLASLPEERKTNGWYDAKPKDLVSLFREWDDSRREYEEEEGE
jgi:hypothetical protein